MISIDKIVQQLQQCRDTSIILPASNESIFVQKTAIEIRKSELELLNNNFTLLSEANYTMDNELEKINENLNSNNSSKKTRQSNTYNNTTCTIQEQIPNKSLIIYMENETANLPEILLTLLNNFKNVINFKPSEWYIYGVKNPESFYKSFLLLSKIDFIIKNRTEMKNEVATFKREMAMKYEDYYKTLNYRKLKFKHNEMIHNLTSIDNYTEFDVLQFTADYNKVNYIILDIVNEKYFDIEYSNSISNIPEFIIIIKYAANTYLPLMNSNGKHSFNRKIIDIISKNFERIVLDTFKEPRMIINNNDNSSSDNTTDIVNNSNECEGHNLIYNIEDAFKTDLYTGLNSSLDTSLYSITLDSIISDTFISKITNPIEDMIEIEEQEYEPMTMKNTPKTTLNTISNNNSITNLQNQPVVIVNDLASLLSKIPMSKPKPIKNNTSDNKTSDNKTSNKNNNKISDNSGKTDMEELKPLVKYNLVDLQMMSKFYKVDTQKMGTSGKKINKLKAELYDEIKAKM
jgi:hypothetical protein